MHFEARGLRIIARLWRSTVNFLLTIPEDIQGDLPDTVIRIYCTLFVIQKMYMARRSHNFKKYKHVVRVIFFVYDSHTRFSRSIS